MLEILHKVHVCPCYHLSEILTLVHTHPVLLLANLPTPSREDLFAVDPNSGELTVKNGQLLDRERQAVYYLTLQATDGGNQSSTTTLKITLLDINDNPPVVQGSYNIFVPEEDGNVSVTIQVRATRDPVGELGRGP